MSQTTSKMKINLSALFAGLLFGVGLVVSGMTDPTKVFGFLNVTEKWDPSLALVMVGALLVFGVGHHFIMRRSAPLLNTGFNLPSVRAALNWRLMLGAALFGAGWAISGFCPGPALVAAGGLMKEALIFLPASFIGMILYRLTLSPTKV